MSNDESNSDRNGDAKVQVCYDSYSQLYGGLTKREHFAGLALQGILASGLEDAAIYECAVHAADKLLEELDK